MEGSENILIAGFRIDLNKRYNVQHCCNGDISNYIHMCIECHDYN